MRRTRRCTAAKALARPGTSFAEGWSRSGMRCRFRRASWILGPNLECDARRSGAFFNRLLWCTVGPDDFGRPERMIMIRGSQISGIAAAAVTMLVLGAAALAQVTPPPAPLPPTMTITTPGYPAARAARPGAAHRAGAGRQDRASSAGDARNHPMGLVRQCASPGAAGAFRRHHGDGNHDARPQPDRARHHHRSDQEAAHRFSRPRPALPDGADLHRGGTARATSSR